MKHGLKLVAESMHKMEEHEGDDSPHVIQVSLHREKVADGVL